MYEFIQKAHSGWAYIVLLTLAIAAVNALAGKLSNRPFKTSDRQISLLALIAAHTQLVIGLILYFVSPLGKDSLGVMTGTQRLTSLEHPLINLIALVLITVGWSAHKRKTEDAKKFQVIALMYSIGLVLIASRIPYQLWF
ncbi:hypothetical protein [Flavobacterium silvaticum]|uniref:Cytochrome B n=1 Tax=Flavobacterium silvaticum TaxID=1852020 RepID=A0A972FQP8_9FLAO|nr:hypothetical protein [Flavobacterium silvaticum]NMH27619.1 hypothetical protein [Flavobacterium silvaticum]